MAGASVTIGVDVTQFKQGMQEAQNSAKTLNAQLKANEAQFKATGDKEQYLADKAKLLKAQLDAQKSAAMNAQKALEAMRDNGVAQTSNEYQRLETQLANATAAMYDTQNALNSLTGSEQQASGGAAELTDSLNGINKKMSLDQVISGIGKITSGLEAAAAKAVEVGKSIWDDIKTAAKWADDSATMAEMYDVPLERYLQMEALYKEGLDTSTTAILDSMSYVTRKVGKESADTMKYLTELGLVTTKTIDTGFGKTEEVQRLFANSEDLFWKAGKAIFEMGDQFDKEAAATAIFGKSWKELTALFKNYGSLEEYNAALEDTTVNSEDAVKKMAELNDKINKLEESWNTAKFEVLSSLAGPLKDAAESIATLLNRITEYLKTDEGQEKLKKMEEAVSALFEDLANIDPEKVVENFASVFEGIVNSFQWISDHWEEVKTGLRGIAIGFGALKLAQIGLNITNLISGFKGLGTGSGNGIGGNPTVIPTGNGGGTQQQTTVVPTDTAVKLDPTITQVGATSFVLGEYTRIENEWKEKKDHLEIPISSQEEVDETKAAFIAAFAEEYGEGTEKYNEMMAQLNEVLPGTDQGLKDVSEAAEKTANAEEAVAAAAEDAAAALGSAASSAYAFGYRPGMSFDRHGAGGLGGSTLQEHANGLWSVPFDGYPAILHRGERVVPAREVQSRSYNSNLYVESMIMNNGTDAEGLAAAMAAAQRRTMSGYGS